MTEVGRAGDAVETGGEASGFHHATKGTSKETVGVRYVGHN